MARLRLPARILFIMAATASRSWAGSIVFTNTSEPGRVTLHVTIVDDGGAPSCHGFRIARGIRGGTLFTIPRVAGTTTHEFVDDGVESNTTYFYWLEGTGLVPE